VSISINTRLGFFIKTPWIFYKNALDFLKKRLGFFKKRLGWGSSRRKNALNSKKSKASILDALDIL
jgi:hypothetical protein